MKRLLRLLNFTDVLGLSYQIVNQFDRVKIKLTDKELGHVFNVFLHADKTLDSLFFVSGKGKYTCLEFDSEKDIEYNLDILKERNGKK